MRQDYLNNVLLLDIIRLLKMLIKFDVLSLYETKVFCPQGHVCNMTRQLEKDSGNKDITEFKCKICHKKGKCHEGRYICA